MWHLLVNRSKGGLSTISVLMLLIHLRPEPVVASQCLLKVYFLLYTKMAMCMSKTLFPNMAMQASLLNGFCVCVPWSFLKVKNQKVTKEKQTLDVVCLSKTII